MDLKKVFAFIEEKKGYEIPFRFKVQSGIPIELDVHHKGTLVLSGYKNESLGDLKSVEKDLHLDKSTVKSLGNLERVGGSLYLMNSEIQSLGNLKYVGNNLSLNNCKIQSLGNLEYVGGVLTAMRSEIESLGNLRYVGGGLTLNNTPLSKKYTEDEIRQMVDVKGSIWLFPM